MDNRKIAYELGGLFLIFWGLFVLLGLVTFDPSDPSLNHVVSGKMEIHNRAGLFGAYLSGFLHDLFGIGAYIWPLVFLLMGGAMVSTFFDLPWWRWCGAFLLAVCLLVGGEAFALRIGDMAGGGIAGRGLYENARYYLSPGGSSLLWLFVFLTGLQLSCDISWLTFLKRLAGRLRSGQTEAQAASPQKNAKSKALEAKSDAGIKHFALPSLSALKEFVRQKFSDQPKEPPPPMPALNSGEKTPPVPPPAVDSALFTPHGEEAPLLPPEPAPEPEQPEPVFLEEVRLVEALPEEPRPSIDTVMRPVPAPREQSRGKRIPLPGLHLLSPPKPAENRPGAEAAAQKGQALMNCLKDFSVEGELVRITPGPVVTRFELRPAPGIKVSRISALIDDLALSLKALSVRIEAPIPGSDTVGIEIPNDVRETVNFRELLASEAFNDNHLLPMALGKDIAGRSVAADLARMPHLLVAGATGAGKSVCLNSILLSFLYKLHPDQLRLLLIDPKRIELAVYADLPHLVHPVVTETAQAKTALDWAVHEMDRRYECMARLGARNIAGYNQKLQSYDGRLPADIQDLEFFPYLVIIIDELADLMLTAAREVETSIVRLAQLARAAGIHMILATQRPSVDVVTGLIKANFPCRISFQVTSKHDSRTILDGVGAEYLLGKGDMLFKSGGGRIQRLHGPFVSDDEVTAVTEHWRRHMPPSYKVDFAEWGNESADAGLAGSAGDAAGDPLYPEMQRFVQEQGGKISISLLQRRFRIGFNRAARIMEQLERDGLINADNKKKN